MVIFASRPASPSVAGLSRAAPNGWTSFHAAIRASSCPNPRGPLTVSSMGSNLPTSSPTTGAPIQSLLSIKALSKQYVRGGLLRNRVPAAAVSSVDFEIPHVQTLALVGESG